MPEILILGGGVAGISAARHAVDAGREAVIYEAAPDWGGLLGNFTVGGFRFDMAVHFGFSNNEPFRAVLEKTKRITHRPQAYNYESGRWLKHPVQNNLYPLPAQEKVEAIKSFMGRPEQSADPDYRQWLAEQFGEVIALRFPGRYTKKYWTVPPEELTTQWIGNRLYRPSLDEVLYGAMSADTAHTYYLKEFFYPEKGGFRAFLDPLIVNLDIKTDKRATHIDSAAKRVEFSDGSSEYYELLVSSVPLPDFARMLTGVPDSVKEAAESLWATSIALVSVGLNSPRAGEHLWFYIYDQDILPARVHLPYRKSPDNAPEGCSSLQFEIYYSRHKPLLTTPAELTEHVLQSMEKMQLASKKDIAALDYRTLQYGNVVFDHGMTKRRDHVLQYLDKLGILPVGRFGEWDYLWTDQCYLSGKKIEKSQRML